MQGAIEISKLRLWLWLISDYSKKYKIHSLPNIEYNFKVGNSLIGWIDEKLKQIPLIRPLTDELDKTLLRFAASSNKSENEIFYEARKLLSTHYVDDYITAFNQLFKVYSTKHGLEAERLREVLEAVRKSIYDSVNPSFLSHKNEKDTRKKRIKNKPLLSRSAYKCLQPFHWRVDFGHIIKEGGFDVVIGNPPYVRIQTLENMQVQYFNSNYRSATKNYDIYVLFVERGFSLLSKDGVLAFIISAKFINADYGIGVRKCIIEDKSLFKLLDFKDYQVFNGVTTYTCLLFLDKNNNKKFDYIEPLDKKKLAETKTLENELFKKIQQKLPISESQWIFGPDELIKIFNKLNDIDLRLGDISKHIFQGLITGADKVYLVSKLKSNRDLTKVKNNHDGQEFYVEKKLLKKLLKGKEMRRWHVEWDDLYILYPYYVKNNTARLIPASEMKKVFPNTYKYFKNYESKLRQREKDRFKNVPEWYQFGRLQNIGKFEQTKILTQVLSRRNSFTFDKRGEYYFVGGGTAGGYGVVLNDDYYKDYLWVLSLINSKVLEFYLKRISTPFRSGFFAFGKKFIEKFPIMIPSDNEKRELSDLVTKQLDLSNHGRDTQRQKEIDEIDTKIDEGVFKVYGISKIEQKIINDSTKRD